MEWNGIWNGALHAAISFFYFLLFTFIELLFLCPVALHTALNRFMLIFQIALILRAV
jgi:hypothetical protein